MAVRIGIIGLVNIGEPSQMVILVIPKSLKPILHFGLIPRGHRLNLGLLRYVSIFQPFIYEPGCFFAGEMVSDEQGEGVKIIAETDEEIKYIAQQHFGEEFDEEFDN